MNIEITKLKSFIPEEINPTPDYYCTWQTQLYATSDGKPEKQRKVMCENSLFSEEKPYGWAYFYKEFRKDLFIVMDDSWDVPLDGDNRFYGSLLLSRDKFPSFYDEDDAEKALKMLSDKIKKLGWKGLGVWVCAQEPEIIPDGQSAEEYWTSRLKVCDKAGIRLLKVDWGKKAGDAAFRRMLVELAKKYAPRLFIENAIIPESIKFSDIYRTYDVPEIMSIPMTMEKIADCLKGSGINDDALGLINCEDEVYIAAAGGFSMGVMRHPYCGKLPNGRADMSFPECHRNIKSKTVEIKRAVNWHKVAPAFGGGKTVYSDIKLDDFWKFKNKEAEIEAWWFDHDAIKNNMSGDVLTKTAVSAIARNIELPGVYQDKNGDIPYVVVSKNPSGAVSVAALGRTKGRRYFIPKCDIEICGEDADTFGIFGRYNSLKINSELDAEKCRVLAQDLADNAVFDITKSVKRMKGCIIIDGEIIERTGTLAQPDDDTSEAGLLLKIMR